MSWHDQLRAPPIPFKAIHEQIWDSQLWGQSEQCLSDIADIKSGLKELQLWSLKVLDSSTKIPNGILTGNLVDLGNFDECLEISFPNSSSTGKHCMSALAVVGNSSDAFDFSQLPSLTVSFCIPSSCAALDLEAALNMTLTSQVGGYAKVTKDACHVAGGGAEFSAADIFSISLFSVVFLVCIASTIYDIWRSRTSGKSNALLRSFSFAYNGQKLFDTRVSADTMRSLNGLRFLSIAWVILGHRYFFQSVSPIMNLIEVPQTLQKLRFQLIAGAVLSVDTFFLMSGFLNAYLMMKLLDKTKTFPALKYYVHRYIRTTPALAAMILVYSTWYIHIGNGPVWDKTVMPGKMLCDNYWWSTLLYINNYYNPIQQCAGQSWYLAVDMQLYWLSPLVLIPCWKWPKFSKYYLGFLLLLSIAGQFTLAYIDKIRMAFTITTDLDEYQRVTESIYVPTHARASPYIIGIMLGLFLHDLKKTGRKVSISKFVVAAGWLLSAGLCLATILGNYPFMQSEQDHPYNRLESSFYISLHRVSWGMGISWIIFACVQGYGGIVNSILSWGIFIPLGRLTYCLFLCHMAIQQYQLGIIRTTGYYQDFNQVHRYLGDLGMAIICSIFLCLMFESPVINIEKYLESPKQKCEKNGAKNEAYVADS